MSVLSSEWSKSPFESPSAVEAEGEPAGPANGVATDELTTCDVYHYDVGSYNLEGVH